MGTLSLGDIRAHIAKVERELTILQEAEAALTKLAGLSTFSGNGRAVRQRRFHHKHSTQRLVMQVLAQQTAPVKAHTIHRLLKAHRITQAALHQALHHMCKTGRVTRVKHGVYAKV